MRRCSNPFVAAALSVAIAACAAAPPPVAPAPTPPAVAGAGGPVVLTAAEVPLSGGRGGVDLDYLLADRKGGRVWVPAGGTGSVVVLDAASLQARRVEGFATSVRTFAGHTFTLGPTAVALGDGVAYIGSRGDNRICAVDAAQLRIGSCVSLGAPDDLSAAADGMAYVGSAKELWITRGAPTLGVMPPDPSIVVFDASDRSGLRPKTRVEVPGAAEGYAVDDVHGVFYTNVVDKDLTLAVDVAAHRVRSVWHPQCGKEGPRGLGVDSARGVVFVACTDHVVALDAARDGAIVASAPVGEGIDNIDYVESRRELYVAASRPEKLAVFRFEGGALVQTATATTARGARVVVADDAGTAYVGDPAGGRILVFRAPAAGPASAAPPLASDPADAIARVEHGLVPEVRVAGETHGWSIEERLRAHHVPGVSVAVIHDYRVVWAKAYGLADASTTVPLTPATLMQAASVSKAFTAMAALKAVEAGELSLDADVDRSLRSWHLPYDRAAGATRVTLRHLLSHTAGINVSGFPGYADDDTLPTLLQVLDGKPPANTPAVRVTASPGAGFHYSGGGTIVVQQLLVDREGRPFASLMDDAVLAPLGLAHSTFEQPPRHDRFPLLAIGHDHDGSVAPGGRTRYAEAAAGGLWATASDVARFFAEIQLGLEGRSAVVSREVATRMTTPVAPVGQGDGTSVALGTFVEKHGGVEYFGHDGLGQGFLTMARASKTKGEGAVVMANGFAAGPLLLEILRSVAAEYGWEGWLAPPIALARVDADSLHALEGRYASGPDEPIVLAARGDRLELRQPFHEPIELLAVGADTFVARDDGARFEFQRGPGGVERVVRTPPAWPPQGGALTFSRMLPGAGPEALEVLAAGRYDEALAAYAKRQKANPKDPAIAAARFQALGEDLLDRQLDLDRAIPVLRLAVALHPQAAMVRLDLAEALFRVAMRADAAAAVAKAQALFPRDATLGEFDRIVFRWKVGRLRRRGLPVEPPARAPR